MTRVLIVEDERIIAKGIEKQLRGIGYEVAGSASTGEDAIRIAMETRPDLILMDISLGAGIDGVEAAGRIRERVDVPIIYLTANSDHATLERAKLSDPFGYLLKPYDDKDLQTAIEIGVFRHTMEKRLRENEQWLAATLSSIGDGLIATDGTGRVRLMNPLAERLTGWSQFDALDRDVREIFHIVHQHTGAEVLNPILDALATGVATDLAPDTILIDRTGVERPIDDSAAPIRGPLGDVTGAVLVFRDITDRRRLEDHLRQAQKMEAIGRLAGGIAHDFNNIMTVILGFSELLLVDDQSVEERLDAAEKIHDAGKRAAALTQQIMAFSRKQMLVVSVLNLNAVVRDAAVLVRRLVSSNIELIINLEADASRVSADPTQIVQVILNLVANARDAMRSGGRLVISTTNAELDPEIARDHPDVLPGRYVLLAVSDSGAGIPAGVIDHIFEPFYTTKGAAEGTGLGLASVHGIVKQSGGHIDVVTQAGIGSTFRVYLPAVEEAAPTASVREEPVRAGRSECILLVEDEDAVRTMTRRVLERSGYVVLDAPNGREGRRVADAHNGPIALLITDLVMPHMSGRQLAEQLTLAYPAMRVLYMSGYTEDVIVHHGVQTAAVDFLQKPFGLDDFRRKVRDVLDR